VNPPVWIEKSALLFVHAQVLSEHGGREGIRDEGLLDSALTRPKNLHFCDHVTDLSAPAACYAMAIVRNHPFIDGNKRVAFVALALFLALNGLGLAAEQVDAYHQINGAAAGSVDEQQLGKWIKQNIVKEK